MTTPPFVQEIIKSETKMENESGKKKMEDRKLGQFSGLFFPYNRCQALKLFTSTCRTLCFKICRVIIGRVVFHFKRIILLSVHLRRKKKIKVKRKETKQKI